MHTMSISGTALAADRPCMGTALHPFSTLRGIDMKNAFILATVIASAALVACGKKEEAAVQAASAADVAASAAADASSAAADAASAAVDAASK